MTEQTSETENVSIPKANKESISLSATLPQPGKNGQNEWYVPIVHTYIVDTQHTMFENHRKSLIQHCERSELRLPFEWAKVN